MEVEEQDKDRRHQRTAADAGQSNQHPHEEAGERVKRIVRGKDRRPPSARLSSVEIRGAGSCSGTSFSPRWYLQRHELKLRPQGKVRFAVWPDCISGFGQV